jgi:CBS domain-containing protein
MMPRLDLVTVADVMHSGIVGCDPDATLAQLARVFAEHRIHCVVVHGIDHTHEGERLSWGIVHDHDLMTALDRTDATATAGSMAAVPPLTVEPTEPLDRVAALMAEHKVTHVVVVEDDYPVGVVSALDVAGAAGGA